jgi:hypothetical protein
MISTDTGKDRESQVVVQDEKFRLRFRRVVLLATTAWGFFSAGFLVYHSVQPNSWVRQILEDHFAALLGVPMAALMAMCVVVLLRFTAGSIQISGPKDYLTFSGSASEIVFWIFCFLAIVFAIYLLW